MFGNNIRTMDTLNDWDDWGDDDTEWWLKGPLYKSFSSGSRRPVRRRLETL
jgi:hypothetical protein